MIPQRGLGTGRPRASAVKYRRGRGTIPEEPARVARDGADPGGRGVLAQAARVLGARLPRRGRLYGSGQLGHGPRRRRPLRLRAAQRDHAVEPDGDPAAGPRRAAGRRHELRPGPGLPGVLPEAGGHRALGARGDRHRRLRPRGGDRLGRRAQPALRPAADHRRPPHLARRAHRPVRAAAPVPDPRGDRAHADPRDRRRVRDRARPGEAEPRGRPARLRADRRRSCATRTCCTSPWGSSARR